MNFMGESPKVALPVSPSQRTTTNRAAPASWREVRHSEPFLRSTFLESLFIFPKKFLNFIPMTLRNVLIGLVGALLLASSMVRAATAQLVTHVATAGKTEVTVRYSDEISILLPLAADAPPQPGFEWQIISNDSRILRLTSSPKPAPNPVKSASPSAGTTWSATFLALRPGRSIVRFAYVRASDSGVETPTDSREIIVTVDG